MLRFLKTSELGPLRWGLPARKVIKLLGEPWRITSGPTNTIWVYGSLEVFLYEDCVEGVFLYFRRDTRRPFRLPNSMTPASVISWRGTSLHRFRSILQRHRLQFIEHDFMPAEDAIRITVGNCPNAVEAWFYGKRKVLQLVSFLRER